MRPSRPLSLLSIAQSPAAVLVAAWLDYGQRGPARVKQSELQGWRCLASICLLLSLVVSRFPAAAHAHGRIPQLVYASAHMPPPTLLHRKYSIPRECQLLHLRISTARNGVRQPRIY